MLYLNFLGGFLTFSRLLPIMFTVSDEWFALGNWSPTEGIASGLFLFYYRVLPFSLDLLIKFWYPSFSYFILRCSHFGSLRTRWTLNFWQTKTKMLTECWQSKKVKRLHVEISTFAAFNFGDPSGNRILLKWFSLVFVDVHMRSNFNILGRCHFLSFSSVFTIFQ